MKKLLLSLAAVAMAGLSSSAETVVFYAQDASYIPPEGAETFELPAGNIVDQTYNCGPVDFFIKKVNNSSSQVTGGLVRFYQNDVLTISPQSEGTIVIKSVSVACSTAAYAGNLSITTPADSSFTVDGTTASFTSEEGVEQVDILATAQSRFSAVEVEYEYLNADLKNPEISFSEENVEVALGTEFVAPVLTLTPDTLAVTYTSSNEEVATVAEDGTVTIVGLGSTTITATTEETAEYRVGSASYTINVVKNIVLPDGVKEVLTVGSFEAQGSSYADYSFTSSETGITYLANMAVNGDNIQLRSANNNSGLVVSDNPRHYELKAVMVEWADNTAAGRHIDVYGSESPYTAVSDLYDAEKHGSQVGEFAVEDGTDFIEEFEADYQYAGVRSRSSALYLKQIVFVWDEPSVVLQEPELSFSEENVEATLGTEFVAPVLTVNPETLAVSYTSSDEKVATVAEDGTVTLVGAGTTVITATTEATEEYYAASASYTLTVVKNIALPDGIKEELTIESFGYAAGADEMNYSDKEYVSETTGITYTAQMSANKGAIQLRTANNNSGIIVSANPNHYVLKAIYAEWAEGNNNKRVISFYGSESPYTGISDLYATEATPFGNVAVESGDDFIEVADAEYQFAGVRSSDGAIYLTKLVFVWDEPSVVLKEPELSFSEENVEATLGTEFVAPVLIVNPETLAVSYTSSNENVATVAEDGTVTLVGAGTTVITATTEATEEYYAGSASYTLTVTKIIVLPEGLKDELTIVSFGYEAGADEMNYSDKEYVSETTGITYAAQMSANNGNIQLRSKNNNSGIVATSNPKGRRLKAIYVEWAENTSTSAAALFYGSNEPFSAPSDLYSTELTEFGTAAMETGDDFVEVADATYTYGGLRSSNGAMYLKKVVFIWDAQTGLENVEEAEGESVLYDLNGREVKGTPVSGLYIRVSGGKAEKIVVR